MTIGAFLHYVEIQTKLASVIPYMLATLYAVYRYGSFNPVNFIIMFISLISIDMATTAINNYTDYRKSVEIHGKNRVSNNPIAVHNIKESTARGIIYTLLALAVVMGILLTLRTSLVILLIGGISFLIGVFYTFGPIPISRMPLGEALSGFVMGFGITFLGIFIHVYDKNIVTLAYSKGIVSLSVNIVEILYIFLISLPSICGIANIMLANNTCDIEEDISHNRFTLPYYIGRERALKLFKWLYFIAYIDMIALIVLRIVPLTTVLSLCTFFPVLNNIRRFINKPVKRETFSLSVKNFTVMNLVQIVLLGAALVIGALL